MHPSSERSRLDEAVANGEASADPPASCGVAAAPAEGPASRPHDEALELIHAASPRRLAIRWLSALALLGLGAGGVHGVRLWTRSVAARRTVMLDLAGGPFRMGSDAGPSERAPAHAVTVSPYRLDRTEVTVAAYRRCVEAGGCAAAAVGAGCDRERERRDAEDHPITCVDWQKAADFCAWAGKRLPTEVEWEFAARGEEGRRFPWGDEPPSPARVNACDRTCRLAAGAGIRPGNGASVTASGAPVITLFEESDGWATTAPVGSYPAGKSPSGVVDLAGNAAEWTATPFCHYPRTADAPSVASVTGAARATGEDPGATCAEPRRVVRGGSWSEGVDADLESTARQAVDPATWSSTIGFRCAKNAR